MARKREMKGLSLFFFLFTVSQYIGWRLQRDGNIRWTWQGVLGLLLGGLLAAVAVSRGVMWLEDLIRRRVAGHIAGRNRAQTVGADVEQAAGREKAQRQGKWGRRDILQRHSVPCCCAGCGELWRTIPVSVPMMLRSRQGRW